MAEIDFSTLDKMGTELVGEAMVRRYPDMLWIARKRGATGWVVILLEFQATWDRLMALRMAVYQLLRARGERFRACEHSSADGFPATIR